MATPGMAIARTEAPITNFESERALLPRILVLPCLWLGNILFPRSIENVHLNLPYNVVKVAKLADMAGVSIL
jgi:hypothetical protein